MTKHLLLVLRSTPPGTAADSGSWQLCSGGSSSDSSVHVHVHVHSAASSS